MKKRYLAIVIASLGLALCAGKLCAADAAIKIGVAWEGKSAVAEAALNGFLKAMKELAPQADIEIQKDLKDVAALEQTAKRFEKEKGGMVLLRSSGAKLLGNNKFAIPGFFGGADDPVGLGVLKNANAPEGNCTGVTYAIPYATQLETSLKVLPTMKMVVLLLQDGHPTSGLIQAGTKAACESMKIACTDKMCKTKDDLLAGARDAESKGAVVLMGSQSLMMENGGAIAAQVKAPVISYTEKPVADGALCGVVADDNKLGAMLAESVIDVMVKGKAIKDVPVKTDLKPQLLINVLSAKRLNLDIPFEILETAKLIQK